MKTDPQFELPGVVPIMTLSDVVLFPQATLPLYIFEPRYRRMLADSLETHSLFGIATLDRSNEGSDFFEPYHKIATLGMIRSSQANDDGTSSILVQGLTRMRLGEVVKEEPYRLVEMEPILPLPDKATQEFQSKMSALMDLVKRRQELGERFSEELLRFLSRIDDPEIFADMVAYTMLPETSDKLEVLGAVEIGRRYSILLRVMQQMNVDLELRRRLQGGLLDERIDLN
ncbi:MAG: LON peptidase substrate-binding domain-containing protein [Puniceicoccaceae bacterium]